MMGRRPVMAHVETRETARGEERRRESSGGAAMSRRGFALEEGEEGLGVKLNGRGKQIGE